MKIKYFFFYAMGLLVGMTSCDKQHMEDDDDGGHEGRKIITLRSIEWATPEGRTDSLRFFHEQTLSGISSMIQEYWQGAEITSKIAVYNRSGAYAYAAETIRGDVGICAIAKTQTTEKLLRHALADGNSDVDTLIVARPAGSSEPFLSEIRYEKGGVDKFEYDNMGNLKKWTESNGTVITYAYDDKLGFWRVFNGYCVWLAPAIKGFLSEPFNVINNVTSVTRTDSDGQSQTITYAYTYDPELNNLPVAMWTTNIDGFPMYKFNYDVTVNY